MKMRTRKVPCLDTFHAVLVHHLTILHLKSAIVSGTKSKKSEKMSNELGFFKY